MNEANSFLEIFADVFPWHIHHTYDFVLDFLRSRNDLFMKKWNYYLQMENMDWVLKAPAVYALLPTRPLDTQNIKIANFLGSMCFLHVISREKD